MPGPTVKGNGSVTVVRGVIGLLILQSTILVAGIPWAMGVHGSISTIETQMVYLAPLNERYIELLERVKECEVRIQTLNNPPNTGDPFDAVPRRN